MAQPQSDSGTIEARCPVDKQQVSSAHSLVLVRQIRGRGHRAYVRAALP